MAYFEQIKIEDTSGNALNSNGSGALQVDASATTQPVSGTVTAEIEGHGGATLDAAPGAAIPTNAVMVGGSDGTDLRAIATDTGGQVKVLVENASAIPVSLSGDQAVNIAQVAGATPSKTNGLFVVPGDNTNSITMKAASTASVAADTSLVVQINPEQPNLAIALNVQDVADGSVTAGSAGSKSTLIGGVAATSAPSPTAGQQIAIQLDTSGNQRIVPYGNTGSATSVVITQPAAGAVYNRTVVIEIRDASGNIVGLYAASCVQAANTTGTYTFAPGLTGNSTFQPSSSSSNIAPIPSMVIGPSMQVIVTAFDLQTTDQFTAVNILVLKYPD